MPNLPAFPMRRRMTRSASSRSRRRQVKISLIIMACKTTILIASCRLTVFAPRQSSVTGGSSCVTIKTKTICLGILLYFGVLPDTKPPPAGHAVAEIATSQIGKRLISMVHGKIISQMIRGDHTFGVTDGTGVGDPPQIMTTHTAFFQRLKSCPCQLLLGYRCIPIPLGNQGSHASAADIAVSHRAVTGNARNIHFCMRLMRDIKLTAGSGGPIITVTSKTCSVFKRFQHSQRRDICSSHLLKSHAPQISGKLQSTVNAGLAVTRKAVGSGSMR